MTSLITSKEIPYTNIITQDVTMTNVNKKSYSFQHKQLDLKDWIINKNFIDGAHMVLGPTRSGKTTFSKLLLFCVQRYKSELNMRFVIFAGSGKDVCKSIKKANDFFVTNKIREPVQIDTMEELIDLFADIKIGHNDDTTPNHHYLILFDDCYAMLADKKYSNFFGEFASNHRQYNISVIYNIQQLQCIPATIKTNISSLSFVGAIPENQARKIYDNSGFPQSFGTFKVFNDFVQDRKELFYSDRCVIVNINEKPIYTYTVQKSIVNAMSLPKQMR